MSGVDFRQFWGKAKPAPGGAMAHPNAWHCLDVAAAFQELCRLLPEQAAALCRAFDGPAKDTLQALTAAVAFHDLGKYSWAFQAKAPAVFPHCLGEWTQPPSADHTAIGYGLAEEDAPIARVVDSIVGPSNSLVRSSILIPVFGHHGRPIDPETGLGLAATMLRGNGAERNSASRQAARDFADAITLIFNNPCAPPLQPERAIELSWRLAGLIAIADWIGSNQDYFPYTSADIEIDQYWTEFAQPRAHAAVARCGLAPTYRACARLFCRNRWRPRLHSDRRAEMGGDGPARRRTIHHRGRHGLRQNRGRRHPRPPADEGRRRGRPLLRLAHHGDLQRAL
jgi:CRISPR-associated endonuclease/helicase Cas3